MAPLLSVPHLGAAPPPGVPPPLHVLLHLHLIGWLLIGLALLHVVFPRYFSWRTELRHLSTINREMMQVHTFFVALTVLLMGLLCLTSAPDLAGTALGRRISLGLAVFWFARLLTQFFGYSSVLWRGRAFETIVHVVFSLLWFYLTIAFAWVYYARQEG